jgi:uncharacterized protein YbaP (TraB family)
MKTEVIIVTGDRVLRVPKKTWAAFLQAAALVVDTGDMYPHLQKQLGKKTLDDVKSIKGDLDDHCMSS